MIIARLHIEEHDGKRTLVGKTVSAWPLKVGTMLVLKREGDQYLLFELGERKSAKKRSHHHGKTHET